MLPIRFTALARPARLVAVPATLALLGSLGTVAVGGPTIRVRPGDTLWGIARAHHTTVPVLRRLNHIPPSSSLILVGQLLRLPGVRAASHPAAPHTVVSYVVRPGDTVTGIAQRYHVTAGSIMARNHLSTSGLIRIGQRLSLAVPRRAAAAPAWHYPSATTSSAARHRAILAGRSEPSQAAARDLVARTARAYGLDPALALAIAYQESGFQMRVVSPADAIGIMQVLPSTAQFIGQDVLHRRLDPLDPADNVRAGVVLLKLLTNAAPTKQAVAGYYQGLASVRAHGMYADTKQYVANVLALRSRFRG